MNETLKAEVKELEQKLEKQRLLEQCRLLRQQIAGDPQPPSQTVGNGMAIWEFGNNVRQLNT